MTNIDIQVAALTSILGLLCIYLFVWPRKLMAGLLIVFLAIGLTSITPLLTKDTYGGPGIFIMLIIGLIMAVEGWRKE